MAPIIPQTIYTKTAKGILEVRNKSVKLSRELSQVFVLIDGKATVADVLAQSGLTMPQLQQALETLVADGHIKMVVSTLAPPVPDAGRPDDVEYVPAQALPRLNMEVASHVLAETDAARHAQQENRAAIDARLRAEAEGRARALAEMRVQAEAEARAKAEAAARVAAAARAEAEREASAASDPAARLSAEARARNAAAAAVRAEAEARARAEAEARAQALVAEKKAAEEHARDDAAAHAKSEEQAQARAAAEARAREALEAQIAATADVLAQKISADAPEAQVARAALIERELTTERARDDAWAVAIAQGGKEEEPAADLHFDDLAQRLTAKVHAERRARELAGRESRGGAVTGGDAASRAREAANAFPALEFEVEGAVPPPAAKSTAAAPDKELPTIALEGAGPGDVKHTTPEHVPSALERAMMQTAARAEQAEEEKTTKAADDRAAKTAPQIVIPPAPAPGAAEDHVAPALADDEPLHERLNVDRAAHDILAEKAEALRKTQLAELSGSAAAWRRQRQHDDEHRADSVAARRKRQQRARQALVMALIALPALAVAWLQFVPMNSYIPEAQKALSERLDQPVTISTLRYVLLPSPRIVLEGVRVGSAQGIRVDRVDAHAWPMTVMAEPKVFSEVDAAGVSVDPGMLAAIPSWTGGRSANAVHVNRLTLADVKLSIPESDITGLKGAIAFAANGTVKQAVLANEKLKIEIVPQQNGVRVILNASDWRAPFGPPVAFSQLTLDGIADKQQFGTTELSGRIGGGALTGTLAARWEGPMIVGGEFRLQGARIDDLMPLVIPELKMTGILSANGHYALQADSATGILGKTRVEGSFSLTRGEFTNIDLARAVRSSDSGRGGRTAFDELKGSLQVNAGQYSYRNLRLSSGPLSARGFLEVAPSGQLSGRLDAAFETRGSVVARSAFRVTGTVKDPQLVR